MVKKSASEREWAEAAQRCRLAPDEVRMARELGFKPLSLMKNLPNAAEPWKTPVAEWVRELYEKRQRRIEQRRRRRERTLDLQRADTESAHQGVCETHTS
jgi:hypothetical protein